jgi:hypothetical protein
MDTNSTINKLRQYLRTEQDANEMSTLFTHIRSVLFKDPGSLTDLLNVNAPYELKQSIVGLMNEAGTEVNDKIKADEFISALKNSIDLLPRIELTLAFLPKEEIVEQISEWFMTNFHSVVILKISVDPTLIGGSIIAYNGEYKDYSIKNILPNLSVHS